MVTPGAYAGREYDVEPDASTASYFFAAAAVTGGRVKVLGLHREGALQGDVAFLDVLECMGCTVADEPDGVLVAGPAALAGLTVDMSDISDTFMTLAAIAPLATSPVTITGIGNVRLKESDRIAAMEENLRPDRRDHGVRPRLPARVPRHASRRAHRPARRPPHRHGVLGARAAGARDRRRGPGLRGQDLPHVLRALVGRGDARGRRARGRVNPGQEPRLLGKVVQTHH